ncbi:hypothetical protein BJV82DRAFT_663986 [Fennellomyces sp. T-0311]|nr:hypothetical protein BJV82DRAFT_663986 [Fennellomyces sp. T-0311]
MPNLYRLRSMVLARIEMPEWARLVNMTDRQSKYDRWTPEHVLRIQFQFITHLKEDTKAVRKFALDRVKVGKPVTAQLLQDHLKDERIRTPCLTVLKEDMKKAGLRDIAKIFCKTATDRELQVTVKQEVAYNQVLNCTEVQLARQLYTHFSDVGVPGFSETVQQLCPSQDARWFPTLVYGPAEDAPGPRSTPFESPTKISAMMTLC